MVIHSISLFSGVGMLDEGLRAGLRYMGISLRTICHVEREAHSAGVLAARMEEKSLDAAPIWSDICTFNAAAWRGRVDCIVAGFPCQDLSIAGRRAGLDGKRSGLFFEVLRVADDCGAWLLFLENVAGIATATASVVDETEGALEERAAARVVGELADRGWNAEWINLSASDVGASHGRARWFCVAWRQLADSGRSAARRLEHLSGASRSETEYLAGHKTVADSTRDGRTRSPWKDGCRRGVCEAGVSMAHAERAERRQECVGRTGGQQGNDGGRRETDGRIGVAGQALADAARNDGDERQRLGERPTPTGGKKPGLEGHGQAAAIAEGIGRQQGWPEPAREQGRHDASERDSTVADTGGARLQGAELRTACDGNWGAGSIWIN